MSTPRKSTSHMAIPSMLRRPCTPESVHGHSPHARLSRSPDRHIPSSPDRPTKSYLRPTVSSILHHGSSTNQPRKSIDKPPFLPPSSVGINSQHHKNPSSSSKGSLTLKGILTRATNAMKSGPHRMSGSSAGINIGKGSGGSTPVRPRSPANLPKKKEGSRNFARSNSVPKKLGVVKKEKERDNMSICSIEDNLPEHLPDPLEITPEAPKNVVLSTTPHVEPQEPSYTEKIEENVHEEVIENSIVATEGKQIDKNHKEVKVEEIYESPKEVDDVKVIEECREEQPKVEEEVKETPKESENAVIDEKHEEETQKAEAELPRESETVPIVEEQETRKPEEAVTELPKEPEEIAVVSAEEENKEEPKQPEDKEITTAENHEAPKEEIETQDRIEEEKLDAEPETKVEETPKAEENGIVAETPKLEENVKETPKVEEKPTEEVVVETPKVEEKPVDTTVAEPKEEKATSKKPDAVATRREGAISNDVIEETKSKLMEKKKNKVLALVGAFETVMQKPEEGSTRR